jgi:hypothetical protein
MSDAMAGDVVVACADLVGRAGASALELGWTCPHVPGELDGHNCPDVTWYATAVYKGARLTVDEHPSPTTAALALAERLLRGATCKCGKEVAMSDGRDGCRWQLVGQRWKPGCDAAPVTVKGGRGDFAAMRRAIAQRTGGTP